MLRAVAFLLIDIDRKVTRMATDQATFDAALNDFLGDLEAGLAAIQSKLDEANVPVDLSTELSQIQDAKTKFDAQVATDTASAVEPPAADASGSDTATVDDGA